VSAWWVIVNPAAGRGTNLSERVESALATRGIDHEIRVSAAPEAVPAIVGEGRDAGYDSFVSVGGDGTANLVRRSGSSRPDRAVTSSEPSLSPINSNPQRITSSTKAGIPWISGCSTDLSEAATSSTP